MNKDLKEQIILSSIIDDLRKFEHKELNQCPYYDEVFEWNDVNYNPEEQAYSLYYLKLTV